MADSRSTWKDLSHHLFEYFMLEEGLVCTIFIDFNVFIIICFLS